MQGMSGNKNERHHRYFQVHLHQYLIYQFIKNTDSLRAVRGKAVQDGAVGLGDAEQGRAGCRWIGSPRKHASLVFSKDSKTTVMKFR